MKVNAFLQHKHVYLIVSRHTLKHTMQQFQNIKNHRENQRNRNSQRGQGKNSKTIEKTKQNKNNKIFRPMSTLADMGLTILVSLFCLVFSMVLIVFPLTSLVVLVSLVFPMVLDIFKCARDSSKRLGRGCAPLLSKAFTLHEFPY